MGDRTNVRGWGAGRGGEAGRKYESVEVEGALMRVWRSNGGGARGAGVSRAVVVPCFQWGEVVGEGTGVGGRGG